MHHFFVRPDQIVETDGRCRVYIRGTDVNHMKNVLRIEPGEQVLLSDGQGKDYRCRVVSLSAEEVAAEVLSEEENRELPAELILYQGLAKGEKMEWIIQKAVELGVSRIVPMATENTVVKLEPKKEEAKRRRWQAIAESAAKQSKRSCIPEVEPVSTLSDAVKEAADSAVCFFAYEHQEGMAGTARGLSLVKAGTRIAVFIGPEGGFSEKEAQIAQKAGICPVSLGKRILRTETAGLALLSVLMMKLELGN